MNSSSRAAVKPLLCSLPVQLASVPRGLDRLIHVFAQTVQASSDRRAVDAGRERCTERPGGRPLSGFAGLEFHDANCHCASRSRSFPAKVTIVAGDDTFAAHWQDNRGWVPCVTDSAGFARMYEWALSLGLDHAPTFEGWTAYGAGAVAEANEQPFEVWHGKYRTWLKWRVAAADGSRQRAVDRLRAAEKSVNLAQCRARVSEVSDPELRAAAYGILGRQRLDGRA